MDANQHHWPPIPLADIGDIVSAHVEDAIRQAIEKLNSQIRNHEACLVDASRHLSGCRSAENERRRLAYLRSNDAAAKETYELLGAGTLLTAAIGKWIRGYDFGSTPTIYKTKYRESIYTVEPIDYLTLSPTVNLYGVQFGTDKLEHIFQQGFRYYRIYRSATARSETPDAATRKAIRWGQFTEKTYFGSMVSGVFSNGDLFANYAGMKFYQGLANPITIGYSVRPAIVIQNNGMWEFNPDADLRRDLMRPFISQHLNEALNPSIYAFTIYGSVRRKVATEACPQWISTFAELSKVDADAVTNSLTLWNGEDYGHAIARRMVTIGGTCF